MKKNELEPVQRAKKIATEWADIITSWEQINGRNFPWRENRSPYRVLISEVILKRNTPNTSITVYGEFLREFPDVNSLYHASIEDLELILQPIGLYKQKSKQLKLLASCIIEDFNGEIPSDYDSLVELPNIGQYTASAVLCFGYGEPKAIVGSNVDRIFGRVFSARMYEIETIADILVDKNFPDVYNYGLLDLGALCHFMYPKCEKCPVNHLCDFKKRGNNLIFKH